MKTFKHLVVCTLVVLGAGATMAEDKGLNAFEHEGVLTFETDGGEFKWWLDGRVNFDLAFYSGSENELANGAELRRVRLAIKSILWGDWAGELDINFADDEAEVEDAWIAYAGFESSLIKIGNHKEPFSLEELTSSRYTTFLERSLPNVFAPGRSLGVSYSRWSDRTYFAAGVFGEESDEVDETGEDDGYGVSGRFSFTPVRRDGRILHLGASAFNRTPDAGSDDRVRFRVRPETHVNRERFLSTGKIRDVDDYSGLGLELAASSGSFSFQSEYIETDVSRMGGEPDASFDGYYAYVSWFPTGDVRPYSGKDGEYTRVTPTGEKGAVELALRFSTVDLTDLSADVTGGSGDIITLGLNWYANANIRFMLNVSQVDNDQFADADGDLLGGDSFNVVQTRFQLTF